MKRVVLACLLIALLAVGTSAVAANDPGLGDQWGLHKVRAPEAWATARGAGAVVAVVDSGVDLDHEDLAANLVAGRNFVGSGPPQDDDGHGSHVSGIVAAVTDNGRGVASVAPAAKVMPLRALAHDDATGTASGSASDISEAIRWAADHGAHVVNLSLGENVAIRNLLGSSIEDAVSYAWSRGTIPVIAAGNDFLFPSGYGDADAIVVSATEPNDVKAGYSNGVGSAKWGLAAPGSGILSTYWAPNSDDVYAEASGTSMATPHVAGAAALLRSMGLGPRETVDTLLASAKDLGSPGRDSTYGSGRLDAAAAVARAAGSPEPPPSEPPAPPPTGESTGETATPRRTDPGSSTSRRGPTPTATGVEETATPSPTGGLIEGAGDVEDGEPSPRAVGPGSEDGGTPWALGGLAGALVLSAAGVVVWRRGLGA